MISRCEQYDGRASVSTWLFAIAANACRDRLRSAWRTTSVPLEAVPEPKGEGSIEGGLLEKGEAEGRPGGPRPPDAGAARGAPARPLPGNALRRGGPDARHQRGGRQDARLPRRGDAARPLRRGRSFDMDCREALEIAVARTAGEPAGARDAEADVAHRGAARAAGRDAAALDEAWERIALPDPEVPPVFRETDDRPDGGGARPPQRRPVPAARRGGGPRCRRRPSSSPGPEASFSPGRARRRRRRSAAPRPRPPRSPSSPSGRSTSPASVSTSRGTRASGTSPSGPTEADGRLSISFDVTTRYTVTGRPEDRAVGVPPRLRRERAVGDRGGARPGDRPRLERAGREGGRFARDRRRSS